MDLPFGATSCFYSEMLAAFQHQARQRQHVHLATLQTAQIPQIMLLGRYSHSAIPILSIVYQCNMRVNIKACRFNKGGKRLQIRIPRQNHDAIYFSLKL